MPAPPLEKPAPAPDERPALLLVTGPSAAGKSFVGRSLGRRFAAAGGAGDVAGGGAAVCLDRVFSERLPDLYPALDLAGVDDAVNPHDAWWDELRARPSVDFWEGVFAAVLAGPLAAGDAAGRYVLHGVQLSQPAWRAAAVRAVTRRRPGADWRVAGLLIDPPPAALLASRRDSRKPYHRRKIADGEPGCAADAAWVRRDAMAPADVGPAPGFAWRPEFAWKVLQDRFDAAAAAAEFFAAP